MWISHSLSIKALQTVIEIQSRNDAEIHQTGDSMLLTGEKGFVLSSRH